MVKDGPKGVPTLTKTPAPFFCDVVMDLPYCKFLLYLVVKVPRTRTQPKLGAKKTDFEH